MGGRTWLRNQTPSSDSLSHPSSHPPPYLSFDPCPPLTCLCSPLGMVTRRQPTTVHVIPELLSDAHLNMQKHRRLSGTHLHTLGYSILILSVFLLVSQLWIWSGSDSLEPSSRPGSGVFDHHFMDTEQDLDSLRYQPTESPESKVLPASTWSCTLEGDTSKRARKSRQCVVQHVCVDDQGRKLARQAKFAPAN